LKLGEIFAARRSKFYRHRRDAQKFKRFKGLKMDYVIITVAAVFILGLIRVFFSDQDLQNKLTLIVLGGLIYFLYQASKGNSIVKTIKGFSLSSLGL
jgi:hypothetical protein